MSDEHSCPRCNAPFLCFNGVNTRHFKCGSSTHIPSVACGYASQLQERIKRLEEALGCVVVSCNHLHHRKKHQHRSDEPCPVEELIRKAKEAKP